MFPHYLACPENGRHPGVLVLHSWWGLNVFFRSFCDRLADAGFVVLAPDLFDGQVARTEADAKQLRKQATARRREPAYKMLIRAIEYLRAHPSVSHSRIGVAGFSMGGHWALWLSQRPDLPIAATVVFYASRDGDYRQSQSKFAFHLAQEDPWVSSASLQKMKLSLERAGRSASYCTYPGTGHWFMEGDRSEAFEADAAALAWERTVAFLRQGLGGEK
ncbi:MAG: dienelactone hydrolase family protein [Bryobacterales bacterium]|nr:dienelactone hydrolase family protein [Bryobacterales bacterium]